MDTTAPDLAALLTEVASLRKEVERWKHKWKGIGKFLLYSPEEDGRPASLDIRCASLGIEGRSPEEDVAVYLTAEESGGRIWVAGRHRMTVVDLGVDAQGAGKVEIANAESVPQAAMMVTPTGDACSVVFRADGKPAALMKGMKNSGSVAVTAPDGTPRVTMYSDGDEDSRVAVLNSDPEAVAQMKASDDGGIFLATQAGTQNRAVLGVMPQGPGAVFQNGNGGPQAIVHVTSENAAIQLQSGDEHGTSIMAMAMPEQTGIVGRVREDEKAWELLGMPEGSMLDLKVPGGLQGAMLQSTELGGSVTVCNAEGNETGKLAALQDGALLQMHPPSEEKSQDGLAMHVGASGSLLILREAGQRLVEMHGGSGHGAMTLRCSDEARPVVHLASREDAQFVAVMGSDDANLAALMATESGGSISVHNELGILRGRMGVMDDGGGLQLNWGGTPNVAALATEEGGVLFTYGPDGKTSSSVPRGDEDDESEPEK